jgi:hypothetical protein
MGWDKSLKNLWKFHGRGYKFTKNMRKMRETKKMDVLNGRRG